MAEHCINIPPELEARLQKLAELAEQPRDELVRRLLKKAVEDRERAERALAELDEFRKSRKLGWLTDEVLEKAKADRP